MLYIIMCGGYYDEWSMPKQLVKIKGEPIVARTIRLLREYGISDIAISSNDPRFGNYGVPVLHHENRYEVADREIRDGIWCNAFYPMQEPVCYMFGDVVFSKDAIRTIVETNTDSIEFFASSPPFSREYKKEYAEPFAFKVMNVDYFWRCIEKVKEYHSEGKFWRSPIAWELWQVIKNTPLNEIDYSNYKIINDYTCDIDWLDEAGLFDGIG